MSFASGPLPFCASARARTRSQPLLRLTLLSHETPRWALSRLARAHAQAVATGPVAPPRGHRAPPVGTPAASVESPETGSGGRRRRIRAFLDQLPLGLGPRPARHPGLLPRARRRAGGGLTPHNHDRSPGFVPKVCAWRHAPASSVRLRIFCRLRHRGIRRRSVVSPVWSHPTLSRVPVTRAWLSCPVSWLAPRPPGVR